MQNVKLLGTRSLDFESSDGKRIKGVQVHVCFPEENVTGHAVEKIFVKAEIELPKTLKVGGDIQLFFDRKGKVIAVRAAE